MSGQLTKLSEAEINEALDKLPDWSLVGDAIQRNYQFDDFVASMAFVNKVADAAEARQHHPDILIRYNKVMLTLSTHDAGGITQKDFDLAAEADAFAG
ncbi:MAG: 4a-hydroxytetrahydrobiopterin dehydratase [Planctomycetota bacterium]